MKSLHEEAIKHAEGCCPNESCGFIANNKYVAFENVASSPQDSFVIASRDWRPHDVVVHSHPQGERFLSGPDRLNQVRTRCDWWLVVDNQVTIYPYIPLLKGRIFEYSVSDCCTIVVDAYRLANIQLKDGVRLGIEQDIEQETIVNCFRNTGFYQVDYNDLKAGDVILTKLGDKASHAGLYIDNEQVLHHEINKLSHVTSLQKFTRNNQLIHSVWRHKEWQEDSIIAVYNDLIASI